MGECPISRLTAFRATLFPAHLLRLSLNCNIRHPAQRGKTASRARALPAFVKLPVFVIKTDFPRRWACRLTGPSHPYGAFVNSEPTHSAASGMPEGLLSEDVAVHPADRIPPDGYNPTWWRGHRQEKRMERDELQELHYITPMCNLPSILQHGLLSNVRAARHRPASVAMPEIQNRRFRVKVPGGRRLHDYVNLYICARNPMMYKVRAQRDQLCVLSVSTDVLDLPGVVVTDGNASSNYVRFAAAPAGLSIVDKELTFADDWTDQDRIQYYRKKSAKCAEVLVPECVAPGYLRGAYVWSEEVRERLQASVGALQVEVNRHLFFA